MSPQNTRILTHLEKGKHITRLEAFFLYGIQNLTSRITELRDSHNIVTEIKRDENGRRYARYSLAA